MKKVFAFFLLVILMVPVIAAEISTAEGAELNITTRTTFGLDLDNTYRYGLDSEFINFSLMFHLFPYQPLTNRVKSPDPVGFIDLTLFHLDLDIFRGKNPLNKLGYNAPDAIYRDRLQTGSFKAGIAFENFVIQLNSGGNEPFAEPWNKAYEFVNDGIKVSWANLESMVDVRRTKTVDLLQPQDIVVSQFTQSALGNMGNVISDNLGLNIVTNMIALMYNGDGFGFSTKFGTEKPYDSTTITELDANGLAFGYDMVIAPTALAGFRTLFSAGGSLNYGADSDADPFGAGVMIAYDITLDEATSIEPFTGFDTVLNIPDAEAADQTIPLFYELSAGLVLHWPGKGGWYKDYLVNNDGRVFPGMSVAYSLLGATPASEGASAPDSVHNLKFTMFEERGDEGLFYGIGAEVIVDFTDFTNPLNNDLLATLYFDYSLPGFAESSGVLVPWTVICYDNLAGVTADAARDNNLKVDFGVKLENAIPNTTFGISWNSGNLLTEGNPVVGGFLKLYTDISF